MCEAVSHLLDFLNNMNLVAFFVASHALKSIEKDDVFRTPLSTKILFLLNLFISMVMMRVLS